MPIEVRCECNKRYRVPERHASKRFRCKACGGAINVPGEAPTQGSPKTQKARVRPAKKFKKPEKGMTSRPLDPVAKLRKPAESPTSEEVAPKKAKKKRRRKVNDENAPELRGSEPTPLKPKRAERAAKKGRTAQHSEPASCDKPAMRRKPKASRTKAPAGGPEVGGSKRSRAEKTRSRKEVPSRKARNAAPRGRAEVVEAEEATPSTRPGLPMPLIMIGAALVVLLLGVALFLSFSSGGPDQAELAAFAQKLEKIDSVLANGYVGPAVDLLEKQAGVAAELDLSDAPELARDWRQFDLARAPLSALARAAEDIEGSGLQEALDATRHELPRVRLAAVMLLRNVEEEGVDEALYALVAEPDASVRAALRKAFVERGGEDVIVPLLVEALDEDRNLQAAERLLAHSDPQALNALARNLPEMTYNRGLLRRALAHIEEHGSSEQAEPLQVFLQLGYNPGMQLSQQQLKDIQSEVETLSRALE